MWYLLTLNCISKFLLHICIHSNLPVIFGKTISCNCYHVFLPDAFPSDSAALPKFLVPIVVFLMILYKNISLDPSIYLNTFAAKIQETLVCILYRYAISRIFAKEVSYALSTTHIAKKCCPAILLYFCTPTVQRCLSVPLCMSGGEDVWSASHVCYRGFLGYSSLALQFTFYQSTWMKKRSVSLCGEPTASLSKIFVSTQAAQKQLSCVSSLQSVCLHPKWLL